MDKNMNDSDAQKVPSEVPDEPSEVPKVPSEIPKMPSEVPDVPSEAASRNPDLLPEIVRAVANEFIGVFQPPAPPPPVFGFTLANVIETIKWRPLFLLIGLVVGVELAALMLAMAKPLYAVSAQVVITQQAPGQLIDTDSGSSAFIATQAEVLHSLTVVQAAVATLPRPSHLEPEDDAVADALDAVDASAISGTRVIALGYLGADASYGAELLAAMVDVYVAEVRDTAHSGQGSLLETKGSELEVLLQDIEQHESQINELRGVNAIIGTADEAAAAQSAQLEDHVEKLAEARNRRIELESRLASGGATPIADNPVRIALQDDLRQAQSELAMASIMLTGEHPTYVAAKRNVDVLQAQLASTVGGSRSDLRQQIDGTARQEAELTTIVEKSRKQLEGIELLRRDDNKLLAELTRMQTQADEWRRELFDQRLVAKLAKTGDVGIGARMIAAPVVPDEAVWPKKKPMLFVGAVLGLAVGFVFALVSLRRKRDPDVVEW
jgi:succinoglycan biosynthesis transport protein ExoP